MCPENPGLSNLSVHPQLPLRGIGDAYFQLAASRRATQVGNQVVMSEVGSYISESLKNGPSIWVLLDECAQNYFVDLV